MRVLVIGCGYVGLPLAKELLRLGHHVVGMTRSPENAQALLRQGIQPVIADISQADALAPCSASFDWIVNLVSSSHGGVEAYRSVYLAGTRNLIDWLRPTPPRLYLAASSTSVYAQMDGSRVDESSSTESPAETSRVLIEMEKLLLDAARQSRLPAVLLRMAGIYGPGRIHLIEQFFRSPADANAAPNTLVNMIHLDDVIGAILSTFANGRPGQVYNVVDDEPTPRDEIFAWLAQRRQRELTPPVGNAADSRRTRPQTNKRVLNHKLKTELGYRLQYPTFREGFNSLLPPTD